MLQLTFNPRLTLTGFRTTRPRSSFRWWFLGSVSGSNSTRNLESSMPADEHSFRLFGWNLLGLLAISLAWSVALAFILFLLCDSLNSSVPGKKSSWKVGRLLARLVFRSYHESSFLSSPFLFIWFLQIGAFCANVYARWILMRTFIV